MPAELWDPDISNNDWPQIHGQDMDFWKKAAEVAYNGPQRWTSRHRSHRPRDRPLSTPPRPFQEDMVAVAFKESLYVGYVTSVVDGGNAEVSILDYVSGGLYKPFSSPRVETVDKRFVLEMNFPVNKLRGDKIHLDEREALLSTAPCFSQSMVPIQTIPLPETRPIVKPPPPSRLHIIIPSAREKGALFQLRNRFDRRNVTISTKASIRTEHEVVTWAREDVRVKENSRGRPKQSHPAVGRGHSAGQAGIAVTGQEAEHPVKDLVAVAVKESLYVGYVTSVVDGGKAEVSFLDYVSDGFYKPFTKVMVTPQISPAAGDPHSKLVGHHRKSLLIQENIPTLGGVPPMR
ncbi:hypothetical protein Bbelb_350460 [Branchiostoma belcheri]|nr:hypothetical protein Bbelb_350460 [Branchiostoma belcheri]